MLRWHDVLAKLIGPGTRVHYSESDVSSLALSPNETVTMLTPYDDNGAPLKIGPAGSTGALLDEARLRIGVEVCYCSTMGDCWMLRASGRGSDTTSEVGACPKRSERTFLE